MGLEGLVQVGFGLEGVRRRDDDCLRRVRERGRSWSEREGFSVAGGGGRAAERFGKAGREEEEEEEEDDEERERDVVMDDSEAEVGNAMKEIYLSSCALFSEVEKTNRRSCCFG